MTIEIHVRDNGPLMIRGGDMTVMDGEGKAFDLGGRDSAALCRCGRSDKKPFCDGSHRDQFESQCRAS